MQADGYDLDDDSEEGTTSPRRQRRSVVVVAVVLVGALVLGVALPVVLLLVDAFR